MMIDETKKEAKKSGKKRLKNMSDYFPFCLASWILCRHLEYSKSY